MHSSSYQLFKSSILTIVPLSKDAVHIYIGVACLLISALLLRLTANSFRALMLGFLVSVLLEVLDLRDDYVSFGRLRWAASLKDVINTNAVPLLMILLLRSKWCTLR